MWLVAARQVLSALLLHLPEVGSRIKGGSTLNTQRARSQIYGLGLSRFKLMRLIGFIQGLGRSKFEVLGGFGEVKKFAAWATTLSLLNRPD